MSQHRIFTIPIQNLIYEQFKTTISQLGNSINDLISLNKDELYKIFGDLKVCGPGTILTKTWDSPSKYSPNWAAASATGLANHNNNITQIYEAFKNCNALPSPYFTFITRISVHVVPMFHHDNQLINNQCNIIEKVKISPPPFLTPTHEKFSVALRSIIKIVLLKEKKRGPDTILFFTAIFFPLLVPPIPPKLG